MSAPPVEPLSALLTHCAAYLARPLLVEPLLDRFAEEAPGLAQTAEEYMAMTREGAAVRHAPGIDRMVESTPHQATRLNHLRRAKSWESAARVICEPRDPNALLDRVPLPLFYAVPLVSVERDGPTLAWYAVRCTPVSGSRWFRPHFRIARPKALDADGLVRELFAAGGLENVFHAVVGTHYFAVPPFDTACKTPVAEEHPCPT